MAEAGTSRQGSRYPLNRKGGICRESISIMVGHTGIECLLNERLV